MKERVAYIDGLRGIAVLAVVLFHAGVHNPALSANPHSPLSFVLRQGSHGVDLFFVLSGFCLAYPMLARLRSLGASRFNVAAYAARRVVRILPPYYAAIAVFTILGFALLRAHVSLPGPMAAQALSPAGILKQALFLDGDRQFIDASFWTLAIEFRWYFLFPVLLWIWVAYPRAFGVIALACIACGSTQFQNTDFIFLPFFMLGILAAELYARNAMIARIAAPSCIVMLAIAAASTADGGWYYLARGPLWGIAMFCVVAAAGSIPLVRRLLSARILVAAGATSYGIYLVHEPVVALIERSTAQSAGSAGAYALAVVGALAAGVVFSLVAEQPFVNSRLREKLLAHLQPAVQLVFDRLGMRTGVELGHSRPAESIAA